MKERMNKSLLQKVCAVLMVFTLVMGVTGSIQAATKPSNVTSAVKKAVKSSNYPFGKSDKVTSSRRVFGVSVSKLSSYEAYEKTTGSGSKKTEYLLFVGKASSKSDAKKIKADLKDYVDNEAESMDSYLSADGKKAFKGAKVGYKGYWVWAVVLKTSSDSSKAEKAIKKKI